MLLAVFSIASECDYKLHFDNRIKVQSLQSNQETWYFKVDTILKVTTVNAFLKVTILKSAQSLHFEAEISPPPPKQSESVHSGLHVVSMEK